MKRRLFKLLGLVGFSKPDDVDRFHALAAKGPVRDQIFKVDRSIELRHGIMYDIKDCDFRATEKLGNNALLDIPHWTKCNIRCCQMSLGF